MLQKTEYQDLFRAFLVLERFLFTANGHGLDSWSTPTDGPASHSQCSYAAPELDGDVVALYSYTYMKRTGKTKHQSFTLLWFGKAVWMIPTLFP